MRKWKSLLNRKRVCAQCALPVQQQPPQHTGMSQEVHPQRPPQVPLHGPLLKQVSAELELEEQTR